MIVITVPHVTVLTHALVLMDGQEMTVVQVANILRTSDIILM